MRIADLHAVALEAAQVFGAKACGLARLIVGGANVPAGFAVEATPHTLDCWTDDDREQFRQRAAALLQAGPLAVRSSAVGEDGAELVAPGAPGHGVTVAALLSCGAGVRGGRRRSRDPVALAIIVYHEALRAFRDFPEARRLLAVGIPENRTDLSCLALPLALGSLWPSFPSSPAKPTRLGEGIRTQSPTPVQRTAIPRTLKPTARAAMASSASCVASRRSGIRARASRALAR